MLHGPLITDAIETRRGDPRFHAILDALRDLHEKKQDDYGAAGDPLANIRASEVIGIPAWKGAWLRARDKVGRIDAFCMRGKLSNEGVEDSWMDLATYSIICLILFREAQAAKAPDSGPGPPKSLIALKPNNRVFHGSGAPIDSTGVDGDYYHCVITDRCWGPKAGPTWGEPSKDLSLAGGVK